MYNFGRDVKKNYKEALRLFTLSANQGLDAAQYNLGHMYYTGRGIDKDKIISFNW